MSGEPDQVLWRGVRPVDGIRGVWPARNSTRINKSGRQTTGNVLVLYVVPAGKKLFIASSILSCWSDTTSNVRGSLEVTDTALAVLYDIAYILFTDPGMFAVTQQFSPALEAAATDEVRINPSSAGVETFGAIFGWLEDA